MEPPPKTPEQLAEEEKRRIADAKLATSKKAK